jgi:hypothetical protein
MAVNTTGITPAANFIPEVWTSQLSDAVQANIVLSELVDRSFEADMKKFGDICHITNASNPAVRVKSEDTSATWANITESKQDITINRQAYVAFLGEDIAEVQAQVSIRELYSGKAVYSLMAHIEGDTTSGLQALPASFSQLTGTLGVDPTEDDWLAAANYLDEADVPGESRFCYCSPSTYNSLLKIDKFVSSDFVQGRAVEQAKIGILLGVPFYKSTLCSANSGTAGQSYNWFCHKRGVALIVQRAPTPHAQYVILETAWGYLIDVIYQFGERLITPKTLGGTTATDVFNCGVRGP